MPNEIGNSVFLRNAQINNLSKVSVDLNTLNAEFIVATQENITARDENSLPIATNKIVDAVKSVITSTNPNEQLSVEDKIKASRYVSYPVMQTIETDSSDYYIVNPNVEYFFGAGYISRKVFKITNGSKIGDIFHIVFKTPSSGVALEGQSMIKRDNVLIPQGTNLLWSSSNNGMFIEISGIWNGAKWFVAWTYME